MGFVGPVVAVAPLAQTTEGGRGGRRAINDRIEGGRGRQGGFASMIIEESIDFIDSLRLLLK